jgi:hypothetical protein
MRNDGFIWFIWFIVVVLFVVHATWDKKMVLILLISGCHSFAFLYHRRAYHSVLLFIFFTFSTQAKIVSAKKFINHSLHTSAYLSCSSRDFIILDLIHHLISIAVFMFRWFNASSSIIRFSFFDLPFYYSHCLHIHKSWSSINLIQQINKAIQRNKYASLLFQNGSAIFSVYCVHL